MALAAELPMVLAHQGGWDEFLWFVVPLALGWWAIRAAQRRAGEKRDEPAPHSSPVQTDPDGRPRRD